MKRGVGLKFQCELLEPQRLNEWLFEHVGSAGTRAADESIVAKNEERGEFYTYNHPAKVLRIALWTELTDKQTWPLIQTIAARMSKECGCNLTTYAADCYEWDETKQAHICKYDTLIDGEIVRHVTKSTEAWTKVVEKPKRWN